MVLRAVVNGKNHGQQNHCWGDGKDRLCRADLVAAVYDCRGLPVQTPAEEDLSAPRLSMTADHQEERFQLKRDSA